MNDCVYNVSKFYNSIVYIGGTSDTSLIWRDFVIMIK